MESFTLPTTWKISKEFPSQSSRREWVVKGKGKART